MQLSTTFRHMDASQAVREYAAEKLDKIKKYFNKDPIYAHAVFAVERGFNHVADINITLPNGIMINAKEVTEDMYSSIDLAAARIERQVRKWKEKIRDHKPHGGPAPELRERVIQAEDVEPQPGPTAEGRKTAGANHRPSPRRPPLPAIGSSRTRPSRPLDEGRGRRHATQPARGGRRRLPRRGHAADLGRLPAQRWQLRPHRDRQVGNTTGLTVFKLP
jgi:putative sigma-54 modulation protein